MRVHQLDTKTFTRLVISLTEAELRDGCGYPIDAHDRANWGPRTEFGAQGLDLDEMERRSVVQRVLQFFNLNASDYAELFASSRTIGELTDHVYEALDGAVTQLTFVTMGHDGEPLPTTHSVADLAQEVDAVLHAIPIEADNVLAGVAPHEVFGFVMGVLLPAKLEIGVTDIRALPRDEIARACIGNDLIVAGPAYWKFLSKAMPRLEGRVTGITTQPMPREVSDRLRDQGLVQLIQIYSTTESSVIGWRSEPSDPYALFSFWKRLGDGRLVRTGADGRTRAPITPHDLFVWEAPRLHDKVGARRFHPTERPKTEIEISGTNVFPARIASIICDHEGVARCSVRLARDGGMERVKAHIILKDGLEPCETMARSIETWCRDRLSPMERPRLICFDVDPAQQAVPQALSA